MFKITIYQDKMSKTFDILNKDLGSLSTGRANANLLDRTLG